MKERNVTALILAAGYGSRIADVTLDPKSLLPVAGKALIDWHIEQLGELGVKNIVLVTGYKREMLEAHVTKFQKHSNITFAINDDYRVKGNTYSMLFGLEKVQGPVIVFDADLIYEKSILENFLNDERSSLVLVGENSIDDIEAAKTLVDQDGFVRMTIDKRAISDEEKQKFKFVGEAIGILKFSKSDRDDLEKACRDFLAKTENVSKNWEHVMNEFLITHNMSVHMAQSPRWVEIDNKEDYQKAKELFE